MAEKRPDLPDAQQTVLLVVDDEPENLDFVLRVFRRDFEVHTAVDGVDALRVAADVIPDIIITDQRMPNMTGLEFLGELDRICPGSIRIVLTGYADVDVAVDAINTGHVVRFLNKPVTPAQLRTAVSEALEDRALDDEARQFTSELLQQHGSLARQFDSLEGILRGWQWDPITRARTVSALLERIKRARDALALIAVEVPWGARPTALERRNELVAAADHLRRLLGGARFYHYDSTYFFIAAEPTEASTVVEKLRAVESPRLRVGGPVAVKGRSAVEAIEAALVALDTEA